MEEPIYYIKYFEDGKKGNNYLPIIAFKYDGELKSGSSLGMITMEDYIACATGWTQGYVGPFGCSPENGQGVLHHFPYHTSDLNIDWYAGMDCAIEIQIVGNHVWTQGIKYPPYNATYLKTAIFCVVIDNNNNAFWKGTLAGTLQNNENIWIPPDVDNFGSIIPDGGQGYSVNMTLDSVDARSITVGNYLLKNALKTDPDNPYDGGDDKGDDDNTPGDYDHTSDPVPEPDLPSVSVTDSGLVTLFAPTESQLKALADYLWSDAFSLDNFKKMLNNPMDCILGLTIIPVNVPHGSAREITVGNIVTTVSCDICPTQYVKVDCGTFTFNRHDMTNSYLDYAPYSKCYLYLPFIGVQEINIDDFMQSTMHVVYHVDILTGAMFCYVMRNNSVMYTYMGQCAENVPLSSSSYSNTIGSIMSAAASIVGVASVAATGGASAPVAAGLLAGASTSTANAVTSLKPSVAHSGSIGGGAGIMGVNYPYLIFNTPHISIPSQQRHYTGYPSNQIVKLSALSGFNVIQAINLSVSGANDSEMNEIESMLKGGVIL